MKQLEDKRAIITGAGRGIGRSTAELFAKEGADLILIARNEQQLKETAKICEKEGVKVAVHSIDLAEISVLDNLFNEINEPIDILVNNAAMFSSAPIEQLKIDTMQQMLDVNLFAPLYLSQKIIPLMKENKGGTIVNVSSLSGCFGVEKFPGFGAYNISKYSLWGLTEILALECKKDNIRINQVSPAGVDTEMFRKAVPAGVEPQLKPKDVAAQILYLASDVSYPLTGENIMLMGM